MNDNAQSAVESLYLRWKALRAAGHPADPAALCASRPDLLPALERRIAADLTDDPRSTKKSAPRAPAGPVAADVTGAYVPQPPGPTPVAVTGDWGAAPGTADAVPDAIPVDDPAAGRSRYQLVAEHARGGMGRVSVAVDTELDRRVAFKDIQDRYADDPGTRHRFTREALITGQLEHPGVIPVYGLGTDERGRPFYAMRFVEGESLKDAVGAFHTARAPAGEPVGPKAVAFRGLLKRFADVCNAIAFAHSKGVVHRDLKPANVMLGPFGETLVVDWGLARSFEDRRPDAPAETTAGASGAGETADFTGDRDTAGTRTGQVMGTPAYMSPEQAAGDIETLGPAWDVYSLGATLYELLTGRAPFGGKAVAAILRDVRTGDFQPPRAVARWVPKALDAVVLKAMALRPEDRYASALDLAAEVERYLADEPVLARRETRAERARRWAKRHPVLVRTVALLFLLGTPALAVGLGVVSHQKSRAEEAERQKDGALQQTAAALSGEQAARAGERNALRSTERALAAETRSLEQVRATFDLTTDELVGKVLSRQTRLGPEERAFLMRLAESYADFAAGAGARANAPAVTARARIRVAQIRERLNDLDGAAAEYKAAMDLLRPLPPGGPADPRHDLSTACVGYGRTVVHRDRSAAADALVEGLRFRREATGRKEAERQRDIGLTMLEVTEVWAAAGETDQAEQMYLRVRQLFQPIVLQGGAGAELVEVLGRAYDGLAQLYLGKKPPQYDAAYRELDGAVGLFAALEQAAPGEARYRHLRARSRLMQVGLLSHAGKVEEAEQVVAPLVNEYRQIVRQYPAVREYRHSYAAGLQVQGTILATRGKLVDALKALDAARGAFARLADEYPEFDRYPQDIALALRETARVYRALGRADDAAKANEEADALEGKLPKK